MEGNVSFCEELKRLETDAGHSAQEEREYAIKSFKKGAKTVMVASGIASKVCFLDGTDTQLIPIGSRFQWSPTCYQLLDAQRN